MIISDLIKQQYNLDQKPHLYFWRDNTGNEIDCIIDKPKYPIPIEIKSGKTVVSDFFKEINYWNKLTDNPQVPKFLVYGGTENQNWPQAKVLSWESSGTLIKDLY